MPFDFPSSPTIGDVYTLGSRKWTWTGYAWQATSTTLGLQGTTGVQGTQGTIGVQGPINVSVYDSDQSVISQQVFG